MIGAIFMKFGRAPQTAMIFVGIARPYSTSIRTRSSPAFGPADIPVRRAEPSGTRTRVPEVMQTTARLRLQRRGMSRDLIPPRLPALMPDRLAPRRRRPGIIQRRLDLANELRGLGRQPALPKH